MKTMRKLTIIAVLAAVGCIGAPAEEQDTSNVEGGKLKYRSYDVLFTNPDCGPYALEGGDVETVGTEIPGDPVQTRNMTQENAYCFPQLDSSNSGSRPMSPLYRLKEWIGGTVQGDEIFAAYFSFSNSAVKTALRDAAGRGVDVTFVKDSGQDNAAADFVSHCKVNDPTALCDNVHILQRGNTGDIGYHHNKFLVINGHKAGPNDTPDADGTTYVKIVFSSGNMSSGTVLHQENWHFIEAARSSYFAQSHVCVTDALADATGEAYKKRKNFTEYLDTCRAQISTPPETDIQAFFIPNKGDSAELRRRFTGALESARHVDVAAHRFSLWYLQSSLKARLQNDDDFRLRLVADDDLYWLYPRRGEKVTLGDNMPFESNNVYQLRAASEGTDHFEVRYIETNSEAHLLHHNKFVIALDREDGEPDAVVTGAANFTNDAFWYGADSAKNNFENIYYITIPHVVAAMERQYNGFYGLTEYAEGELPAPLATPIRDMPITYTRGVMPSNQ